MNENRKANGTPGSAGTSVATGFVLGALVGAGMALLLAPRTGKETRRRLVDTGRRWSDTARRTFDQARYAAKDLKQDAKSALEAGREGLEHGQESS